jgi:gliding motility-associated-like protein
MRKGPRIRNLLTFLFFLPSLYLQAQNYDCDLALIICSDSTINFRPDGGGINDFANPNNDSGCFVPEQSPGLPPENYFEQASGWFYFEFRKDMPDSSIIEFAISPVLLGPMDVSDYDFAIYGPNVRCDSLGSPRRCSFVNGNCAFCPDTGLGRGEIDESEDTWVPDNNANGFVAPMVVQPGDGFFLFLEYFEGDTPVEETQFDLSWGGSAAPFLNCIANPFCYKAVADAGRDTSVCAGATIQLFGSATNTYGQESYIWTGSKGATDWIEDPFSTTPTVNIPFDFSGRVVFELLVEEGNCEKYDSVVIDVIAYPPLNITGDNFICEGEQVNLEATPGFESYLWSTGETTASITVSDGGTYDLTVTNSLDCERVASYTVFMEKFPDPIIKGPPGFCVGESVTLSTDAEYASIQWTTGAIGPTIEVNQEGTYGVTVITQLGGCVGTQDIEVVEFPEPTTDITGKLDICPEETTTLSVSDTFSTYTWSTGGNSPEIDVGVPGIYSVEVTDQNGCKATDMVETTQLAPPQPVIVGAPIFCPGDTAVLSTEIAYVTYEWSSGANTRTADILTPGEIRVTVTDDNGCQEDTTFSITQYDQPQPQIIGETEFCAGDSVQLQVDQVFASYQWSTGAATDQIEVKTGGTFQLSVTDANGCRGEDDFELIENLLPQPTIDGPAAICDYETARLEVNEAFVTYQWEDGSTSSVFETNQAATYSVTVTDAKGCAGTQSFDLQVNQAPEPEILGERTFCQDDTLRLEADQVYAEVEWSTGESSPSIGLLLPGEYSLTVTDQNGCLGDTSATIIQFSKPTPFIEGDNEICTGESVALRLDRSYQSYLWDNGANTSTIQADQGKTYSVTITDVVGCEGVASFEVTENLLPEPIISGPAEICSYEVASLSVQEGFETYVWQDGTTANSISAGQTGVYSIEVSDEKGCVGTDTFDFRINAAPIPQIQGDALLCRGDTAVLSTQNADYVDYAWSTGANTPTIDITAEGTYQLSVTDDKGCEGVGSFETLIKELPEPTIDGVLEFCENGSTQIRTVETFVSYEWSTGQTGQTVDITQAGSYAVTVTDEDGCRGQQSASVSVNENPRPQIMGDRVFCSNESTDIRVMSDYAVYRWSTGERSVNIVADRPGTYMVTVIDDKGCSGSTSAELTTLQAPEPEIEGDNIFCEGDTITFGVRQDFVSYNWSNGALTQAISVDIPDNYHVTVTDVNGCMGETTFQPIQFSKPRPVIEGQTSFCEDTETELNTERTYSSYLWSNGLTDRQIRVDQQGTYTITVVDSRGCEGTSEVFVTSLPNPEPVISGDTQLCTGENTILDAGAGFVTYFWEGGAREQTINVDQAGNYQVTVIDNQGCSGEGAVEVNIFARPDPVISGAEVFCPGDTLQISVGAFSAYDWSTGDQTQSVGITQAGTYTVTVTNTADCTEQTSVVIETFDRPPLEVSGDRFFCENSATILNATPGYEAYEWSNNVTDPEILISEPGGYALEITDQNGCRNQAQVRIQEIPTPEPNIQGPAALCDNETAFISAVDGFATYEWSTGQRTSTIEIQEAGIYQIQVTDAFGCFGEDTIDVLPLLSPTPTLEGAEDFCPGDSVLLRVEDIYQNYNWGDGVTTASRYVAEGGAYILQVTADNGCMATVSKQVTARPSPVFEIQGDTTYCEGESTVLSVPNTFDSYDWSTGDTMSSIEVAMPGNYRIELFNEFGCGAAQEVEVVELDILDPILPNEAIVCTGDSLVLNAGNNYREYLWDDGSTDAIRLVTSQGNYSVTLTNFNGCIQELETQVGEVAPQFPEIVGANAVCEGQGLGLFVRGSFPSYRWSTQDTTAAITVRTAGTYIVTITDRNGCQTTDQKSVDLLPSPKVQLNGLPYFCEGASTVLEAEVDGGDFEWTDGQTTNTITVTEPGNYGVFVRSSNGCTVVEQVTVEEFKNPTPEISGLPQICSDEEALLDAGSGYVRYSWSTGSLEPTITVAEAGTYSVIVTDTSGCQGEATYNLRVNAIPEPIISGKGEICPDEMIALGTEQSYVSYEWSNGSQDSTIEVNESGFYSVQVIDENGCEGMGNFNVREGAVPVIDLQGDSVLCEGGQVQMGVGGGFATIRWSTGEGGTSIDIFEPGVYTVTVTNEAECLQLKSFNIRQVARPVANAGPDLQADCTEPALALNSSGSSIGPEFLYRWTGPDIDEENQNQTQPLVNVSGRYRLVIEDTINGCISPSDEVLVNFENEAPNANVFTNGLITCENDSVRLDAAPLVDTADFTYRWFDENGIEITPNLNDLFFTRRSGLHSVLITDQQTGCTNIKNLLVEENTLPPFAEAGPEVYLSCNQPATRIDATASDQGDSYDISWSSTDGFPIGDSLSLQPEVSRPGWYFLRIQRLANGCISEDSVLVLTDTLIPLADAGIDQRLACDEPFVRLDGTASSGSGQLNFRWTSPDYPDFIAINPQPAIAQPGTYLLKVEDIQNGCVDTDTVIVENGGSGPEDLFFSVIPPACRGDQNGQIVIDSIRGGAGPYLFSFELGTFGFQQSWNQLGTGEYRIIVQDIEGCEYLERVQVPDGGELFVNLGPDQEIRRGYSADIEAFIPDIDPSSLDSILWTPLDSLNCQDLNCLNVEVNPINNTTYTLRIVDSNGCAAEDDVRITMVDSSDVYIPNAFSPDGDGVNDRFTIFASDFVQQISDMQIYDRWGNRTFQRSDFQPNDESLGWDGTFRGQEMKPAVFVYKIVVLTKDGVETEYSGDVTLIR